jgi:recombination protein RecT
MTDQTKAIQPYSQLTNLVKSDAVRERFETLLGKRAPQFLSALLSVVADDKYLIQCEPKSILTAAAMAAIKDLPIDKNMGFAYIVPRRKKGVWQAEEWDGYRGKMQLMLRTNQYQKINTGAVYQGQTVTDDQLTGSISISGSPVSDEPVGYFAYYKLNNGFEDMVYWPVEKILSHAERFSDAYQYDLKNNAQNSPWMTARDDMCKKTMLKQLVKRGAPMSIQWQDADDDRPLIPVSDNRAMTEPVPNFDDVVDGTLTDPEPKQTTANHPLPADELKERIEQDAAQWNGRSATEKDRKILASVLDTTFDGDKTKRYELCKWLAGAASTKEIADSKVLAMLNWLEVDSFNQPPSDVAIQEAKSALTAALAASGQATLL